MNLSDYFKDSVWETFTASSSMSADFVINTAIAMALSIVLGVVIFKIYGHYYGGVVYSNSFAITLVGMTVLTCTLTLAISNNVIISLGMIGALSIVRYRTAIKDPMDLLYLFWAISMGITVAAQLYVLALIAMVVMTLVIHFFYHHRKNGTVYILVVHYEGIDAGDEVLRSLGKMRFQLKSKTVRGEQTEMTVELISKTRDMVFVEKVGTIPGVKDASLIQYNGEYHG